MFVLKDNFSVNAREVNKISSDFVDVYVDKIGRGIILVDDLLCFKKKDTGDVLLCKPFNVEVLMDDSVFLLDDNVGGEADQVRLEEEELASISVLRFNKKIGE